LSIAQDVKNQTVRGFIVDRATGNGIPDAQVELLNHSPRIADQTNEKGEFSLEDIPLGHQRIRIVAEGYYEGIHSELVVAGKEAVVVIALDEEVTTAVVTVEAKRENVKDNRRFSNEKMESVDPMNVVSVRRFNIEEVTKYVGGLGDPARTVTNYPGLFNIDDQQNYIVSRGNSPYGIRWEIEGVPIENPHHLNTIGNTGAIFPLLNNNLLDNSDFINGAMPAQYGNAYSGVFDINLREGNNRKFEFAGQLSLYGLEAVAEGPFKKGASSFAVAYRYGILSLLQLIADIGSNAQVDYQDLNFKINIPTRKAGDFTIFGVGGLSKADVLDATRDTSDQFAEENVDLYIKANNGLFGVTHEKFIKRNTSIKTTLSYLIEDYHSRRDTILPDSSKIPYYQVNELRQTIRLSSTINSKISSKFVVRGGIYGHLKILSINDFSETTGIYDWLFNGMIFRVGGFFQAEYKFSPRFSAVLGAHGTYMSINNNSWAIEPRLSLRWNIGKRHRLSFGYGWHSKNQPFPVLFFVEQQPDGSYDRSNQNLGVTRSHHTVLSYDLILHKYWGLKFNVYGQLNTDIPILSQKPTISLINHGASTFYPEYTGWQTDGISYNYGIELAVEKFFSKGFYGLVGGTYFRSFYEGYDQVWRSTAFDVLYIAQFVAGKEFKIGKLKRNAVYVDLRYNGHGGQPYTPILLDQSRQKGFEVRDNSNAYSKRLNPYNRIDIRIGFRFNHRRKNISHHLYVEVFNVVNFTNDLEIKYSPNIDKTVRSKQFGLTPNLFYQIKF